MIALIFANKDTLMPVLFACATIAIACVVFGGWMLTTAHIVYYLQHLGIVG